MEETKMDVDMSSSSDRVPVVTGGSRGNHQQYFQQQSDGNVRSLLASARQLIGEGKPTLALRAIIMAVKSEGGETAVFRTLHRARVLYRNKKLQENAGADELASLFAECAIAEAPQLPSPSDHLHDTGRSLWTMADVDETSILAESGRKQIMVDAFSDGSSFICLQCGGLVGNDRKEQHLTYWCGGDDHA